MKRPTLEKRSVSGRDSSIHILESDWILESQPDRLCLKAHVDSMGLSMIPKSRYQGIQGER